VIWLAEFCRDNGARLVSSPIAGAGFDPAKTIPVMIDVGCSDASGNAAKSPGKEMSRLKEPKKVKVVPAFH
jgi:hypothetical protein